MSIQKVIKLYFVFVMAVATMAMLTYNVRVENFIVSIFHTQGSVQIVEPESKRMGAFADEMRMSPPGESEDEPVIFSITNDPEWAFAEPGSYGVSVMDFIFRAADEDLLLQLLKLKVVGVDIKNIESAVLTDGEEFFKKGWVLDEYLIFSHINYEVLPDGEGVLTLVLDLGEDLHPGQRIRMDIEQPEDIVMLVGGEFYDVDQNYPIRGKSLSIAKARIWRSVIWVPSE